MNTMDSSPPLENGDWPTPSRGTSRTLRKHTDYSIRQIAQRTVSKSRMSSTISLCIPHEELRNMKPLQAKRHITNTAVHRLRIDVKKQFWDLPCICNLKTKVFRARLPDYYNNKDVTYVAKLARLT